MRTNTMLARNHRSVPMPFDTSKIPPLIMRFLLFACDMQTNQTAAGTAHCRHWPLPPGNTATEDRGKY